MNIGDKVLVVGRHDVNQAPDSVKIEGRIVRFTPQRIVVREESFGSIFYFDKITLKQYTNDWWSLRVQK